VDWCLLCGDGKGGGSSGNGGCGGSNPLEREMTLTKKRRKNTTEDGGKESIFSAVRRHDVEKSNRNDQTDKW